MVGLIVIISEKNKKFHFHSPIEALVCENTHTHTQSFEWGYILTLVLDAYLYYSLVILFSFLVITFPSFLYLAFVCSNDFIIGHAIF